MATILRKKSKTSGATGNWDNMSEKDNFDVIKQRLKHAKEVIPNYEKLYEELKKYDVELPEEAGLIDISGINKLYAITQSFLSRTTEIEISAINNHTRWKRVYNRLKNFIKDKECKILVGEETEKFPNAAMQQAYVRSKLVKLYDKLEDIQDYMEEADAFERSVMSKKKDLQSILTNLSRQVNALKAEKDSIR